MRLTLLSRLTGLTDRYADLENREASTPSRRRLYILVTLTVVAIIGAVYIIQQINIGLTAGVGVGAKAEDFSVRDIDGKEFVLSAQRGKVILIDFMATWCPACQAESEYLKEIYSQYQGEALVMISIGVDPREGNDKLREYKTKYGESWPIASGPGVGTIYQVSELPTLVIIDKDGVIRFRDTGVVPTSTLRQHLDPLL